MNTEKAILMGMGPSAVLWHTWVALTRACTGTCDRWLAVDCYNDSHCGLDTRSGGPLAGRYWVGLGQSSGFPLALWATLTIWPWMASGAAGREKLGGFDQGNPRRGLPSPVDEARGLLTSPSRELRSSSEQS